MLLSEAWNSLSSYVTTKEVGKYSKEVWIRTTEHNISEYYLSLTVFLLKLSDS